MQTTTFNHSVKVPRLFKCAAKISQEVAGGVGSIKQLVYEKKHFNTKALYALVSITLQKENELDLLLKRTKLLDNETRLDPWLAKVLISELIWGKKKLPESQAKPIMTILAHKQSFYAHLSDSSRNNNADDNLAVARKPRYVRINTLIMSTNEALQLFEEEGWFFVSSHQKTYKEFLEQAAKLEGSSFLKDFHVPDLLLFPAGTEFYNHPGYKKGAIILQDKASCLPVHALSPLPGSTVLDMCAAPGMKTTQLAAVLNNSGTLFAVERDQKRFEILKKMVDTAGATCAKLFNEDVLQCDLSNFANVEYILVDPSCSGSGMTDRLELNRRPNSERLQKLAGFQIKILRHALTKFPKAKRVVYSTCSLEPEENEDVVRQVLETNNFFKLVPATNFLDKEWINFGSIEFGDIGTSCLYTKPEQDLTNGFFLAVFERLEEGESNKFYNMRVLNYRKNIDQKQAKKRKKYENLVEKPKGFGISETANQFTRKNEKKRPILNEDTEEDKTNPSKEIEIIIAPDTEPRDSKERKKKKLKTNQVIKETTNIFNMDEPTNKNENTEEDETISKKKKHKKHNSNKEDEVIVSETESKDSKRQKKKKLKTNQLIGEVEISETSNNIHMDEKKPSNPNENTDDDKIISKKKKHKKHNSSSKEVVSDTESKDSNKRKKKKKLKN